jgi:hypothetical protein
MKPSDERAQLADAGRTTRRIAMLAVAIAVVALALTAFRAIVPSGSACQTAVWDTSPKAEDLPADWTISASQYDVDRKQMTLVGALPSDENAAQAVVYATITCYGSGAEDSVTRSADAARTAGQTVTEREDLGDQAFSATDDSGATFLQLRHGNIVVYLAASGAASEGDVDAMASAFDMALGGDGGQLPVGTEDAQPSDDTGNAASDGAPPDASDGEEPSGTPAAPALEATIPTQVGDVALTVGSLTGEDVLGDDQGSRAITAALRADGHVPADLKIAQASDEDGGSQMVITALAVDGMSQASIKALAIGAWLSASGAGVTSEAATVGGRNVTRVDYGDNGAVDYVLSDNGVAYIVSTADPALAADALKALP